LTEVEEQEATIENSNGKDSDEASKKSMMNAISAYRKIKEGKNELTEKEQILLDKECKIIEEREIIEVDPVHEPVEIELPGKGKIQMGPPTLTRFEKARIVGARSLQLSLGLSRMALELPTPICEIASKSASGSAVIEKGRPASYNQSPSKHRS